jgi:hypothetical protein
VLAAAAAVGPAPDDVTDRLDAALAAEQRSTVAAATVTPLEPGRRTTAGMRVLQAAAVLVLLFAGAGLAVSAIQGGGESDTTASEAGGVAADAASPPAAGEFPVTASGRNWSADTLPDAVPGLVAGSLAPPVPKTRADSGGAAAPEASRELADNPVGRLAGGPDLADCVTALNDGPVTPLAVDLASWQGSPAAIVVLPTPDDPSTVDAWVVDPSCAQADAKVLYFARVARP